MRPVRPPLLDRGELVHLASALRAANHGRIDHGREPSLADGAASGEPDAFTPTGGSSQTTFTEPRAKGGTPNGAPLLNCSYQM
jgi:hypothetical protein